MNQSRPKVRLSRALGIPLTEKCVKYFECRPFPRYLFDRPQPGTLGRPARYDCLPLSFG